MAVDSKHPQYVLRAPDWEVMRLTYEGETAVKAAGERYLPPLVAHELDGMQHPKAPGAVAYGRYKQRAVFPDHVKDAVKQYIGMMHKKPATFKLPAAMAGLEKKCTQQGEGLLALLRRINEAQMTTGRLTLLADVTVDAAGAPQPYIAMYSAEALINWDESADHNGVNALELAVLDETGPRRQPDFTWKDETQYRVCRLFSKDDVGNGQGFKVQLPEGVAIPAGARQVYAVAVVVGEQVKHPEGLAYTVPALRGKPLDTMPVVIVNATDVVAATDAPPLLGLGKRCMVIYRGEADYRQTLHAQGQETLVTIGDVANATPDLANPGEEEVRVGAGARLGMGVGGDAKYIGISADGLQEQRTAIENDTKIAKERAGDLLTPTASSQESGEALGTRLAAQTANLTQMAAAGALGLTLVLRAIARWIGANEEQIEVTPNLDFGKPAAASREVVELQTAKSMGAPLSQRSIHDVMRERGLTQMTFEDELAEIDNEKPLIMLPEDPGAAGSGNNTPSSK